MVQARSINSVSQMPPGFRFDPSDEELLSHYLYNKICGMSEPVEVIGCCDLYGKEEPWEIWNRFRRGTSLGDKDLYFFTNLKSKFGKGERIDRTVGSDQGTWHGENTFNKLKVKVDGMGDEWFLASKRTFTYKNANSDQHALWIMHEYSARVEPRPGDTVLCRLRRNERAACKRKREADETGKNVITPSEIPVLGAVFDNGSEVGKKRKRDVVEFENSSNELPPAFNSPDETSSVSVANCQREVATEVNDLDHRFWTIAIFVLRNYLAGYYYTRLCQGVNGTCSIISSVQQILIVGAILRLFKEGLGMKHERVMMRSLLRQIRLRSQAFYVLSLDPQTTLREDVHEDNRFF